MRLLALLGILAATAAPAFAGPAGDFVTQHQAQLDACAGTRTISAHASIRWNARGRITSVRVTGGTPAFRRCASKALAGKLALARRRAGSGRVDVSAGHVDLQACAADADCVLHFQTQSCFDGDPVAVNKAADPAAVAAAFPVKREECAMGGPDYERRRMEEEGRYIAACEQARCVAHDRGPQKAPNLAP